MTTFETTQVQGWIGREAVDRNGDKIGKIHSIYEDDETGGPEWFAISTGLFGSRVSFAPVHGAAAEGDRLRLQWDKSVVKDAPHAEEDGHLSEEEETRLYRHYGMDWMTGTTDDARAFGAANRGTTAGGTSGIAVGTTGSESVNTGAMGGRDDAMTRSEEELDVSTRRREAGRARLRKWVETEQRTVTVPVRREVARLVTEPITDANRDRALDGPEITENEHEIVLQEEEVVVDKHAVPRERVRLETDEVVEEQTVTEDVRAERIAMEDETSTRRSI